MKKNKKIALLLSALILASVTTGSFTTAFAETSSAATVVKPEISNGQESSDTTPPKKEDANPPATVKPEVSKDDSKKDPKPPESPSTQVEPPKEETKPDVVPKPQVDPVVDQFEEGYYTIGNGDLVVDISAEGYGENVPAGVYQANSQNNQLFDFIKVAEGIYEIQAVHSQKALTAVTDPKTNEVTVVQSKYDANNKAQQWKVVKATDGSYTIESVSSAGSLITFDAKKGLVVAKADKTDSQKLTLAKKDKIYDTIKVAVVEDGTYGINSATAANDKTMNLGIQGGGNTNDLPIELTDAIKYDSQRWNLKNNKDGTVTFESASIPSKVLALNVQTKKVVLWQKNNEDNQKWMISKESKGGYSIQNAQTKTVIDLSKATVAAPTQNVITSAYTGDATQRWKLNVSAADGTLMPQDNDEVNKLEDGYYTIGNGGFLVDMAGASYGENVAADAFRPNRQNNQLFSFEKVSGKEYYKIVAVHSQKVLTMQKDGTVVQSKYNPDDVNQQWKVTKDKAGNYYITNFTTGTAITFDAGNIISTTNTRADSQKLTLKKQSRVYEAVKMAVVEDGTYNINSVLSSMNLGIQDNGNKNGQPIGQYATNDYDSQRWNLKNNPDGTVTFEATSIPSKVLDLNVDTGKVALWQNHDGINQKWTVSKEKDGNYTIKNLQTKKVIDLKDNSLEEGDHVITSTYTGKDGQVWKLQETEKNGNNPHADDEVNQLDAGYYTIGNGDSVVDMFDAGYGDNVAAGFYQSNDQNNQLFNFIKDESSGYYEIQAVHSQKALTLNKDGAIVQSKYNAKNTSQQWTVTKDADGNYYLENVAVTGKVITFDADKGLVYTDSTRADNQKLTLAKKDKVYDNVKVAAIEDGTYGINSLLSEKNLGVKNNGSKDGQPVLQYEANNYDSQKWDLKNNSDGSVTFESIATPSKVLDLNVETGQVELWQKNDGANQNWMISKEEKGGYSIKNMQTGNVIDLSGANIDEGGLVITYPYSGNENQVWNFNATEKSGENPQPELDVNKLDEGYYTIGNGDLVVDMAQEGYGENVAAGAYQANNQNNQLFNFVKDAYGTYEIQAVHSQKALTLTDKGTVVQSKYTAADSQQWKVYKDADGNSYIVNANTGTGITFDAEKGIVCTTETRAENQMLTLTKKDKVFDTIKMAAVEDGTYTISSLLSYKNLGVSEQGRKDGQPIYQYDDNNYDSQKWYLKNNKDGSVTFESVATPSKVLDLNTETGKIALWQKNDGANQNWMISKEAKGGYSIKNVQTGNVIDLSGANIDEGGLVITYPYSGNDNQRWAFTETEKSGLNPQPEAEQNKLAEGYYTIGNGNSVVDMFGASYGDNVVADSYQQNNQNNQLFDFVKVTGQDYYKIVAVHSQKVLTEAGGKIVQKTYDPTDKNQQWNVVKTVNGNYYIENVTSANTLTFDAKQGITCVNNTDADNQLLQLSKKSKVYDNIKMAVVEDGTYTLTSTASKKNLFSKDSNVDTVIEQMTADTSDAQKWVLSNSKDGTVSLKSASSSKQIEYDAKTGKFVQKDNDHNKLQRWVIKKLKDQYYICNANDNTKVMGVNSTSDDGDHVVALPFNTTDTNQQWSFTSATPVTSGAAVDLQITPNVDLLVIGQTYALSVAQPVAGNKYAFSLEYNGRTVTLQVPTADKSSYKWTPLDTGTYKLTVTQTDTNGQNPTTSTQTIEAISNGQKTLNGIDVSEWQGVIDWKAVKDSGQGQYAMLRVGYGKNANQKDKFFDDNYAGATANDIPVGVYHYSYASSVQDAKAEAARFLEYLGGKPLTLPVAYDIEDTNSIKHLDKKTITDMAIAFCDAVKAAKDANGNALNYQPMIYCNPNYINNYLDLARLREAGYDVWIASYGVSDYQFPYPVKMWQYTSEGSVPGIDGNVDLNHYYVGSDYMGNTPLPKGTMGKVTTDGVAVRSGPSISSKMLYLAQTNYTFTILNKGGTYWKVSFGGGREGYIDHNYITESK